MKPFKGTISNWRKVEYGKEITERYSPNLGYVIYGRCNNHPNFGVDGGFRTSLIVAEGPDGMIETLNSRYQLIGEGYGHD